MGNIMLALLKQKDEKENELKKALSQQKKEKEKELKGLQSTEALSKHQEEKIKELSIRLLKQKDETELWRQKALLKKKEVVDDFLKQKEEKEKTKMRISQGYFTNDGDFFGPGRKEYLHVTFKNGSWQGLKIVGDINVPRGKVSFRTLADLNLDINNPTPAEIQIRAETWNEDGFSWMEGASVRFDSPSDKWIINFWRGSFSFSRVQEEEALNAAKGADHGCIIL